MPPPGTTSDGQRPRPGDGPAGVCVFAPSTIVTVTIEDGVAGPEVHFHAGGQGFWIARMLGRLGVPTTLCTVLGGESGRVASSLLEAEDVDVRAVWCEATNGAWVHDRRSGERVPVVEAAGAPLGRHETDDLVGATLARGLRDGICVLAGPHQGTGLIAPRHYELLSRDLRANGVEVIADLSGEPLHAALTAGLDFCKASDEDLAADPNLAERTPLAMLHELTRSGAVNAAVTCGRSPTVASVDGRTVEVLGPRIDALDHRGAGDALTAGIAASRFWGLGWADALRRGAAAGTLTVARRGLATADPDAIGDLVESVRLVDVHPVGPPDRR